MLPALYENILFMTNNHGVEKSWNKMSEFQIVNKIECFENCRKPFYILI